MKQFYIKICEGEGLHLKADYLDEHNERLLFFKNNEEIIAEIKHWHYWIEKDED